MRLTTIIATRGRSEDLKRTVWHTMENMSRDDTRLMLAIDDDDQETLDAIPILKQHGERLLFSVKPREDSRGEKYDRALTECPADVYMVQHDCTPIVTPGFDQRVVSAAELYPDGIGCVYGPMANASFPGLQAVTARWAELVGHIYNHEYPFWFIDHELDDIARMVGRFTFVNVDDQDGVHRPRKTMRLRELMFWTTYFDVMTWERRMTAQRIIDALDEPDWHKAIKRPWFEAIEARSRWINWSVRRDAAAIEALRGEDGPPDPGYLRLRSKADEKIMRVYGEIKAMAEAA